MSPPAAFLGFAVSRPVALTSRASRDSARPALGTVSGVGRVAVPVPRSIRLGGSDLELPVGSGELAADIEHGAARERRCVGRKADDEPGIGGSDRQESGRPESTGLGHDHAGRADLRADGQ